MLEGGRQLGLWCDAGFPGTDRWATKPPGAGRWRSTPERAHRRGGPCKTGGPSSGNVVGAPCWRPGRVHKSSVLGLRVGSGWPPRASAQCPALLRATVVRAVRPEAHLHVTEEQTGSERRDGSRVPEPAKSGPQSLPGSRQLSGHPVFPPGLREQENYSPLPPPTPRPGVGVGSVPDCSLPPQPCTARRRPLPTTSASPAAPPPASPGRPAWTVKLLVWTAATAPTVCRGRGWGSGGLAASSWAGADEREAGAQRLPACGMKEGRNTQLVRE